MRRLAARLALLLLAALAAPAAATGPLASFHDGPRHAVALAGSLRSDVDAAIALPARSGEWLTAASRAAHGDERLLAIGVAVAALVLGAIWRRRQGSDLQHAPARRSLPAASRAPPAYA